MYMISAEINCEIIGLTFPLSVKCDHLCENRPCSHLVVLEKHLFKKFELKLTAFAHARPLLFSRTGLSSLLNKI